VKQAETIGKDYYQILGVSPTASARQIKSVYRRLAHKYHPDVPQTGAVDKMTEINEAYEVLSDKLRRVTYDRIQERQRTLWEEEIIKSTGSGFSFYPLDPSTVAAEELSKGKSREQIIDMLASNGLAVDEAVETVDEVFETRAELRKQALISALKFGVFALGLDGAIAGILHLIYPAIEFATYLIIGLVFIIGAAFIVEFSRKF